MKMLLALIVAVAALIMPTAPARADIQTVYYNGTITATGTTNWFPLSGQSTCALTLAGSGAGMSIIIQGASDQPPATPSTVSTMGNVGIVTANGVYSGAVATSALTGIRLNTTAISSGSETYQMVCSGSGNSAMFDAGGNLTGVIDVAAPLEVNASNVLTLNGGRWLSTGVANFDTNDGIHPQNNAAIIGASVFPATSSYPVLGANGGR